MRYETFEKNGKSFITLPIEEFKKLQEDAEMIDDIKAYDAAKAEGGESFPAEVVYRIINGDNPIKAFREYREMTQEYLAEKAHLSRAYIAQIENGQKQGSIASLKNIAATLQVDIDDIV